MSISNIPVVVFAYNFPHRKTQDFIYRLFVAGIPIQCIIAADPVELGIPASTIRSKVRHGQAMHPRKIAKAIGVEYRVMPHSGEKILQFLSTIEPQIGVIAGARILKANVIEKFKIGILNFHPGVIPYARGLDSLLWSIMDDKKLGVTSHLIDGRVDAGEILEVKYLNLKSNDQLFDLSELLYDIQLEMLVSSYELASQGITKKLNCSKGTLYSKMPKELEGEVGAKLPFFIESQLTKQQSETAFLEACKRGDLDTVQELGKLIVDVNVFSSEGWSALIIACFHEQLAVIKWLIDNGADVNAYTSKGTTVLMYAKTPGLQKIDHPIVEFLINKGANKKVKDIFGKTAYDYAKETGATAQLLTLLK